jgi:hypothetical protein
LRELGWVEGLNLQIEPRNAASDAELPALAGPFYAQARRPKTVLQHANKTID